MDAHANAAGLALALLPVPAGQFSALWARAEDGRAAAPRDEYIAGIVATCRWLAERPVWSQISQRAELPRSPALYRDTPVTPEAIQAEYAAAVGPQVQRDVVFMRGVAATLAWIWAGSGVPPLNLDD